MHTPTYKTTQKMPRLSLSFSPLFSLLVLSPLLSRSLSLSPFLLLFYQALGELFGVGLVVIHHITEGEDVHHFGQ